ncbi:MAG TPA: 3-isopropylmalate dehydratase small subunit, partial [Chthonomonadaceae bacterium]|nr:3-isopropylmalate dehydratase small subunit [Chthonomonadaceae bacterium]
RRQGAGLMQPFAKITGRAAPLPIANLDTDQLIPKQFLKTVTRKGLAKGLFYDFRFDFDGNPKPDFVLNQPAYQGTQVLVCGENFGCGSSREHAPWALLDFGIRCVIAPSFADIFYNNCFKNGILPVTLPEETVHLLMERAKTTPGYEVTVDLEAQTVSDNQGFSAPFTVDSFRRHCLLNGLDDIGLTLQHADAIAAYESRRPAWKRGVGQA